MGQIINKLFAEKCEIVYLAVVLIWGAMAIASVQ